RKELMERMDAAFNDYALLCDQERGENRTAPLLPDSLMEVFRNATELLRRPLPSRSLKEKAAHIPLRGMMMLQSAREESSPLYDQIGHEMERIYDAAFYREDIRNLLAGIPASAPEPAPQLPEPQESADRAVPTGFTASPLNEPKAPDKTDRHPISAAIDLYARDLEHRKGKNDPNIQNLRTREKMFVTLMGDMDVRDITGSVLRTFGYRISYLPSQVAKAGSWNADNLEGVLKANGEGQDQVAPSEMPIGEKTLVDKTLGVLRTAIRFYCDEQSIPFRMDNFRFSLPKHTPRSQSRSKAKPDRINEMFKAGQKDERLVQAILPLLGALTGRRISLLAYMRAENLERRGGHWMIKVDRLYQEDGQLKVAPIKNDESTGSFVLHEFLEEMGFIDFVRSKKTGWVFESLHLPGIVDPGDTAQKRLGRLFKGAGVTDTVFHQLRHFVIGSQRNTALSDAVQKKQVGHCQSSAHDHYGDDWEPAEIEAVATLVLSEYVVWDLFRKFDFTGAEVKCIASAQKTQRRLGKSHS
uniref:hypothetical protein n=1 Tax=Roseibium sediminis TaxID=1775174 RepID=UPI00195EA938